MIFEQSTPKALPVALVQASAEGKVLYCEDGLSFWGGVDPNSGIIIDAHHPNHGACLTGRLLMMPTSRGSCSGSGVLVELARNAKAPAALVFREAEDILTLGAMIAEQLFDTPIAVLRLPPDVFKSLANAQYASILDNTLEFDGHSIALSQLSVDEMSLTDSDRDMLQGSEGAVLKIAMEILCLMAAAQGAATLIDVSRAHIDGCILAHDANLDFAEMMVKMGAQTRIPTTINAISVDRNNWQTQGVSPDFGHKASRLADAYVSMGARPTFTCAPYLLEHPPSEGESIGWSESNAVIYANSVLGARTVKHPDYLDLFIAMTGRAPKTGVYLDQNRVAQRQIHVTIPQDFDDALWPMLGWLTGIRSPDRIPVITGLEASFITQDDLKALCAAFGTTSAAPMLHVRGHTPEGHIPLTLDADRNEINSSDLSQVWRKFNAAPTHVDLVAIGSPHASLSECRLLVYSLDGHRCHTGTDTIVTVGRHVLAKAEADGTLKRLKKAGVQVIPDLCWCSITEPVFPPNAKTLMTNSGKYSHYAKGLTGRDVRFGSMADCARAARTGLASDQLPTWLSTE
jgi:predicted aconitase/predicted aconitase with swiveling domain